MSETIQLTENETIQEDGPPPSYSEVMSNTNKSPIVRQPGPQYHSFADRPTADSNVQQNGRSPTRDQQLRDRTCCEECCAMCGSFMY